jgi:subtilisin-like proprotein convertase family protein
MWSYNSDYKKWFTKTDSLLKDDFDFYKQELVATRFYSKALSGSTYVAIDDVNNLYDAISAWKPRNWFVSTLSSQYVYTPQPTNYPTPIDADSQYDFYTKNLKEYGLTLKNLFTPERLMKDILANYIQVDVATVEEIDLSLELDNYYIDGVKLKDGHKVLVKDQKTFEIIDISVNPDEYFKGPYTAVNQEGLDLEYQYYSNQNGLYEFRNRKLVKLNDLDDYNKCTRLSVYIKMGDQNQNKQFSLRRLLNGFYPTSFRDEPMEFVEKHNWLLRNRVDYNNLFETNYYDIIRHATQSIYVDSVTYSIPERTVAVGEFGTIVNTQYGYSNILPCKYKSDLKSVVETEYYYWMCGDNTTLLRMNKHDFEIKNIKLDTYTNLRSISFVSSLRGVVVGDFNTIYITTDGGNNWNSLTFTNFNAFSYNKVIYVSDTKFYVAGRGGVFLEFIEDINGWTARRRRISRQIDDEDEYVLVDHINDLWKTSVTNWGLSYSYTTQSIPTTKDLVFIAADGGKLIAYDENNFVSSDFIYFDFDKNYGDIKNVTQRSGTDTFFFSNDDGIYKFSINDFKYLGVGNTYSNSIISGTAPSKISSLYANSLYDYSGEDLLVSGNYAIIKSSTHSSTYDFVDLDLTFFSKLKSKLLFLDYDMGSKLNFFTDEGNYRLPNSTLIKQNIFSESTDLTFNNIIYGATAPSFMTQSEVTWYNYWQDREKTFEYYSVNPLSNSSKVLISKTFSGTSQFTVATVSFVNTNINDILKLAPSFNYTGVQSSRYKHIGASISSAGGSNFTLYLKDYLVILGVTNSTSAVNGKKSFDVDLGDVLRIESGEVEGNLIVNRIENFTDQNKFIYMFSDFNEDIIKKLKTSTSSITFRNLNKFSDYSDLIDNFNLHPLGIGYKMSDYGDNYIKIDPKFNNYTAYYNLATEIKVNSDNDYLEFNSFDFLNYGIPDGTSSVPQTLNCNSNVYPTEIRVNLTLYHLRPDDLKINLIGPSGEILNVMNGNSQSISGFTFSNTTFTTNPTSGTLGTFSSPYTDIIKMNMGLSAGSYSYVSTTINFNDLLIEGNAKGDWKLSVEDSVSSYIGYLKNWSILFKGEIKEPLIYTDGFLKFGYTPRYNLLDYMTSINRTNYINPTFYATKEYLSMPIYNDLQFGDLTASNVYLDSAGLTASEGNFSYKDNKIYFGDGLKLEWESIFVNTFVDLVIYQPLANSSNGETFSVTNERLLVIDKYYDSKKSGYVVEFHKGVDFELNTAIGGSTLDIISRRTLEQISGDLQELNNIQRRQSKTTEIHSGHTYDNYEREINFKMSTDSYAKILLSDVDTVKNTTGLIYTDYKNEIAMNLTRLEKDYNIPILNTANVNGKLYVRCGEKHDLSNGDGVVLKFNGGTYSSEYLNHKYFGYHIVTQVYNEYDFLTEVDYGQNVYLGNDIGFVRYVRKDPFFNYEPVDLIDVSLNKRAKQSIQLDTDNTKIEGSTYSLVNVDYNRYRFRLVDNLTFDDLHTKYPWVLEAEISEALIGEDENGIIWYKGIWEFGRWFGGTWYSGQWRYGDWYGGTWNSRNVRDLKLSVEVDNVDDINKSVWFTGRWYDGTWNDGTWRAGRWYDGDWNKGVWYNGIWNDGTWNSGRFIGGIWVEGTWNTGTFNTDNEPAYWIDGNWYGGDFENGIWYDGIFEQKNGLSRFGTNAYNSRTATWNGGTFKGGSFYSKTNLISGASETHKYSIWKTGKFLNGDWYGGIAYNINFTSGTWHGGILEEIEIIGINEKNNSFTLNGIFRFNISDEIFIIDKFNNNGLNEFGSILEPKKYTVLKCVVDDVNKITEIYVDYNISLSNYIGMFKSDVRDGTMVNSVYGNSSVSTGYSGSTVEYFYTDEIEESINNVRIKINLQTNPGLTQSLSHLLINLKAPNGNVINVKKLGVAENDIYLQNTIFTGTQSTSFELGSPLYNGVYEFSGATGATGFGLYLSTTDKVEDLLKDTTKGYWEVFIKTVNGLDVKVNDLRLEFCYSDKIGAQLNNPITNGFDTGLRVVSRFINVNWKTGIWTNGIYESGLFENGIWYDGIFKGTWG